MLSAKNFPTVGRHKFSKCYSDPRNKKFTALYPNVPHYWLLPHRSISTSTVKEQVTNDITLARHVERAF